MRIRSSQRLAGIIEAYEAETHPKPDATLNLCGETRLMPVWEPELPGATFWSVVSTSVQFSPLSPQFPVCRKLSTDAAVYQQVARRSGEQRRRTRWRR